MTTRSVTVDLGSRSFREVGAFGGGTVDATIVAWPATVLADGGGQASIVVNESFPANPDVVLDAGDSVQPHLTAGAVVELKAGSYGDQQISPATGVVLFCRTTDPDNGAVFLAPSIGQKRWCETGGDNVTLRGIKVDRYGTDSFEADAALRMPSSASGWTLEDCHITRSLSAALQLRGSGHTLRNVELSHCGRYGWSGGIDCLIEDVYVHHICTGGSGNPPSTASGGNNGVCKMAGGSTGVVVRRLTIEDVIGNGLWWDGARDGEAYDISVDHVQRSAVVVEVGWGGAQVAPSGKTVTWPDYAFKIDGVVVNDLYSNHEIPSWPSPSAMIIAQTPGVHVSNLYARDVGSGLSMIYNGSHNVYTNGYPSQNIPASWTRDHLGLYHNRFDNCDVDEVRRFSGCVTNTSNSFTGEAWSGIEFEDNVYGTSGTGYDGQANPTFRRGSDFPLTLSEWRAFGYDN